MMLRKVSTLFRSILKVVGSLAKLYKISRQLGSLSIVARLPTKFLRMSRRLFRRLCNLLPLRRFSKVTKQLGKKQKHPKGRGIAGKAL